MASSERMVEEEGGASSGPASGAGGPVAPVPPVP